MRGESLSRRADRVIAALAARQHGVVARWQLLQAGVTPRQIELRLEGGRLHEIHRGVYLVGHDVPPPLALEEAALLACGSGAALGHRSAGNLWGLLSYPASAPVWVTIPPGRTVRRPRIAVRNGCLAASDVRHRHGLKLTSPPRTILDLASLLDEEELESVVAEAAYRRLASEVELAAQLSGNEGKRGVAKLRRLLNLPGAPSGRDRVASGQCFGCCGRRACAATRRTPEFTDMRSTCFGEAPEWPSKSTGGMVIRVESHSSVIA
jgi:hypothetical protein